MKKNVQTTLSMLLLAAAAASSTAMAQTTSSASTSSSLYGAGNSYVGVSGGRADFSLNRGTGLFASEKRDTTYGVHAGTYFANNFGAELGYTHFGAVTR